MKSTDKFCNIHILSFCSSLSLSLSFADAPSPLSLPIIGHIYLLAKYPTNPWQGFNAIRSAYGDVVRLQLGQYRSVLISSVEAIREVLLVKGEVFSDRPHFERHALIFGQNRQNGKIDALTSMC